MIPKILIKLSKFWRYFLHIVPFSSFGKYLWFLINFENDTDIWVTDAWVRSPWPIWNNHRKAYHFVFFTYLIAICCKDLPLRLVFMAIQTSFTEILTLPSEILSKQNYLIRHLNGVVALSFIRKTIIFSKINHSKNRMKFTFKNGRSVGLINSQDTSKFSKIITFLVFKDQRVNNGQS